MFFIYTMFCSLVLWCVSVHVFLLINFTRFILLCVTVKEKNDKLGCEIFNFYSLLSWYCQKLIPSMKLIILSNYAVLDDKVNIF
jgi:hypothetical protein